MDRYGADVLAAGSHPRRKQVPELAGEVGLVVETADAQWCGELVAWEKTATGWAVVLEDRRGRRRAFPPEPAGFLLDGKLVTLLRPLPKPATQAPARTSSGSRAAPVQRAKVARASRIWVEGKHDAQLVERIWGADLRDLGVVVEELGGIDELSSRVSEFGPGPQRRVAVLVDHLVPGSKETRIAEQVHRAWSPHVTVLGHPYVDVWQAIKPAAVGIAAWPIIGPGQPWKEGVCAALGWGTEPGRAWASLLTAVHSYVDLEPSFVGRVEQAIDLVSD
ncbi:MAG: DUF3097 domain-containing protein [Candidatus Nanopelagicales bacterium]